MSHILIFLTPALASADSYRLARIIPSTSGPGLDGSHAALHPHFTEIQRETCAWLDSIHLLSPPPAHPPRAMLSSFLIFLIEKEKLTLSEHSHSQSCFKTILENEDHCFSRDAYIQEAFRYPEEEGKRCVWAAADHSRILGEERKE